MPTLTRPKTKSEAVIAVLTEYGEIHKSCSFDAAWKLKTVAIAVVTQSVPISASESEKRDIILDSLWSALYPKQAADELKWQLSQQGKVARIYVYEIKENHVFKVQATPGLTRIEIALRQLQELRQPFTLEDVLGKAAIAPATFMSEYRDHLRRLEGEVALSQRRAG